MPRLLKGRKVAILAADGSDQKTVQVMHQVLVQSGADPVLLSVKRPVTLAWLSTDWGDEVAITSDGLGAEAGDFDALILPGGVAGADQLRNDPQAVGLVGDMIEQGKTVAALGHAVWVLIEARAVLGRGVTSDAAMRTDVVNAGGHWVDEPTVVDGRMVTGRSARDLPDFMARVVDCLMNRSTRRAAVPRPI